MRKAAVVALVSACVMVLLPGLAAASKKSDQKLAEKATLRQRDVPDVFEEVAVAGDDDAPDLCGGAIAAASEAALAAPHSRSGFALGESQGYAVIDNEVAVLKNTAGAKRALNAYQDEEAARGCMGRRLNDFFASAGATTEVSVGSFAPELDDKGNKLVIKGGDEFAGFSASVRRSAEGGQPQFFEAIVVIGRVGRSVFELEFISSGTVPNDDVQAMTQSVVTRLQPAR